MSDLRCWLGIHKPDVATMDMRVEKGMGFFGGPLTTWTWNCIRCGKRCIT